MSLSKAEHDELCCVYAGLLLYDDGSEITADKLNKIIKASGNEVEGYYPEFFAKYLAKADIKSMLTCTQAAPAPATEEHHEEKHDKKDDKKGGKKDDKKGGKKEKEKEKKEEKKEEEDDDMGGFGDIFG